MRARRDERGFTLLELLIAVTLSAIVLGGLGTGLMTVLRLSGATTDRIAATHDLEQLRRFLVADVHSADGTPAVVPHALVAGEAACSAGDPVDGFSMRWTNAAGTTRYKATYERTATDLVRTLAEVTPAGVAITTLRTDTVVHNLQEPGLGTSDLGGHAARFPLCLVTGDLPILNLAVTVLVREPGRAASAQFSFPVKVVPRGQEFALGGGSTTSTTGGPPLAPTATLTSPAAGTAFRSNLATTATASATATQLGVEYQPSGSTTWTPVEATPCTASPCTMTIKPGPLGLVEGDLLIRAWAKDVLGQTATSASRTITYDPTPPVVAWASPAAGSVLRGSFGLSATATDARSGVQSVAFARGGTSAGTTTASGSTYATTFSPSGVADGPTTFTVTATDAAGSTATADRSITLDNTAPTGTITAPTSGSKRRGTMAVTGTATDAYSGVASATVQLKASGSASFVDAGTRTGVAAGSATGAFSIDVATASYADGQAELQVVLTDGLGSTRTIGPVAFVIDNVRPRASSVALANGGTAGQLDQGDKVVLGFSEAIDPATACAGLSTTANVVVTLTNGTSTDTLTVDGCAGLGSIAVAGGYHVPKNAGDTTVKYGVNANPSSTVTWDAAARTITITIGKGPGNPDGPVAPAPATYTPGAAITDQAANPVEGGAVSAADQRF